MIGCGKMKRSVYYWTEGWLSPQAAARVEAHLQTCARCQAWLHDLRNLKRMAAHTSSPRMDASQWRIFNRKLDENLSEALQAPQTEPPARRRSPRYFRTRAFAMFAACGVIVLTLAVAYYRQDVLITAQDIEQVSITLNESPALPGDTDEDILEEVLLLMAMGFALDETS